MKKRCWNLMNCILTRRIAFVFSDAAVMETFWSLFTVSEKNH